MKETLKILFSVCLAIALGSALTIPSLAAGETETLLVTVEGIKAGKGNIRVAVFDDAHREEFPEGEYLYSAEAPAAEERVTVEIEDVPPGEYAIAIIQDINDNKKLDRNFLKIPKEPYGFSGAWKKGAATYEEALINTGSVGFEVTIELK